MVNRSELVCFVCKKGKGQSDLHHCIPLEYGGHKDGKTVPLCASCHRGIHREAEAVYKGKSVALQYRHHLSGNDAEAQHNFGVLVHYVIVAKRRHDDSNKRHADTARRMVQISLSEDEHHMLHELKSKLKLSSIEKVLRWLIVDTYVNRGKK